MIGYGKKKTEEEKFAEKIDQGDWKMGFVKCYISPTSLSERYKFLAPINEADLDKAMKDLTSMLANLSDGMRDKLQFRVVFGSEIREIYGSGMCAIVVEEQEPHYIGGDTSIGTALKEIGNKLTNIYTPEHIRNTFKLLVSKRGNDEAYEDEYWYEMQNDLTEMLRRV
jgi:hypothetical protein